MGLQLRVTDALGERLLELDGRPPERANIVGRAPDAEVEVPSSSVNNRHCLLFVRDGRWVVQDAGSANGTFLNGKRLSAPATINSGDTITLGVGSSPPRLTVDPHHVGIAESSDEARSASPPPVSRAPAPWSQASILTPVAAPLPPPVARPPAARPAYAAGGYAAPSPPQQQPSGWEDVPPPTTHYYVPKPKRTSPGIVALFAVLSIGIAAGGCYWLYIAYQKRMASSSESAVTMPIIKEVPQQPASVFDFDKAGSATQPTTRVTPAPPATVPSSTAASEAPPDKRRQDPEWLAIEQARFEEPVLAIVKFNDYLDRFPNTPFKNDLEQYSKEAVDRLWWKRLMELFHERDVAMKEIADRKVQLSQSQDPEFKKGLETEIAGFAERRDRADQTIRLQMKYTSQSPPNLYDSQELAILRANRDAAYYATWSEQILSTIKHSRGQRLPWGSTR
jgi:pSer/pThr/pTyr-binding forkhead associated (FHA) protein